MGLLDFFKQKEEINLDEPLEHEIKIRKKPKYEKDIQLVGKAFKELYPNRKYNYNISIKYSGRFKGYGANVAANWHKMDFHLSKNWRGVSEEIKIGLYQSLLLKLYGGKKVKKQGTINLDMYDKFIKNIHIAIPKDKTDERLLEIFNKVNDKYFYGLLDPPNLVWGRHSKRQLGSYEYAADTIIISSILKEAPQDLLDYVMYHEMLHKKHKFRSKNGKSYHHTREFKLDERKFENFSEIEKRLSAFLAKYRVKKWFFG